MNTTTKIGNVTNGGKQTINQSLPYLVNMTIRGVSDMLLHRYNTEAVAAKAAAKKNSIAKKTDDLETFVYRNDDGVICIPGEYVRQSFIHAGQFRQDPRKPKQSAKDLLKAGLVSLTPLAPLGITEWDYEDARRAVIQRNGVTRVRPAIRAGYTFDVTIMVNIPEYISLDDLQEIGEIAGRMIGIGDFRPTFGRFAFSRFEVAAI
jgi:hypothetical protein